MRRITKSAILASSLLFSLPVSVFAQSATDDAAAATALGMNAVCCCGALIMWGVWTAVAYWVYKDAKKRGNDNAMLWALLTFFVGLIGLLIYIFTQRNEQPTSSATTAPTPEKTE